jgi:hypothetical protein
MTKRLGKDQWSRLITGREVIGIDQARKTKVELGSQFEDETCQRPQAQSFNLKVK